MTHHLGAEELHKAFAALPGLSHYTIQTPAPFEYDIRSIRGLHETLPISNEQTALLTTLRSSYARYGSVPAIDEYDTKSCTLIGMVKSQCPCGKGKDHEASEWHSIRFIPAVGEPLGTDDFALCTLGEADLGSLLQTVLFSNKADYAKHVVSITRICATSRYCMLDNTELPHRVGTTANFWLMNKTFYETYEEQGFTYMTGLFRIDLTMRLQADTAAPPENVFVPAYKILAIPPDAIRINRGVAGYRWPAYFLNTTDLSNTLGKLLKEGKVSEAFVETALSDGFQNFGGILQAIGPIPHTSITGEELRNIVDAEVADSPILRLFPVPVWKNSIRAQLSILGIDKEAWREAVR